MWAGRWLLRGCLCQGRGHVSSNQSACHLCCPEPHRDLPRPPRSAVSPPRRTRGLLLTLGCEVHGVPLHGVWSTPLTCVAVCVIVHVAVIPTWEGERLAQLRGKWRRGELAAGDIPWVWENQPTAHPVSLGEEPGSAVSHTDTPAHHQGAGLSRATTRVYSS